MGQRPHLTASTAVRQLTDSGCCTAKGAGVILVVAIFELYVFAGGLDQTLHGSRRSLWVCQVYDRCELLSRDIAIFRSPEVL